MEVVVAQGRAAAGSIPAPPLAAGRTDAQGRVEAAIPALQGVVVVVDHPAFAPLLLRPDGGAPVSEITLVAGGRWSGAVEGPDSSDLPSGGTVCTSGRFEVAVAGRSLGWSRCAEVAPDGGFRLEGLPDGALDVAVEVPGFLRLERTVEPAEADSLRIRRGVPLGGRVTDPRGRGVAGARIHAEGAASVEADATGAFALSVLRLPVRVQADAIGYRRSTVPVTEAGELVLRLAPTEQVYGTLLGDPEDAVEEVRVWAQRLAEGAARGNQRTVESEDGEFRLDLPEPGRYSLTFFAPGYREVRYPDLEIGTGEARPLGVIALSRGAGVRGAVADAADGTPLAGVLVEALPVGPAVIQALLGRGAVTAVSDAAGAFTLAGLDAGRYHLRWEREGYATVHRLVDLEGEGLVDLGPLFLDQGVTLQGRLIDRSDAARPGLEVRLFDPAAEVLQPWAEAVSDGDGRYRLEALVPGRYRVQVVDRNAGPAPRLLLAQEFELQGGEASRRLDLEVGGVAVRGRLTYGGAPVSGGTLNWTSALEPSARRGKITVRWGDAQLAYGMPASTLFAAVAKDGSFAVDDVAPGLWWLGYSDLDGRRIARTVAVPDREEFELSLDLGGYPLEGRVVDASTRLGLPATVEVCDVTGRAVAVAAADSAGRFRIVDLAPGEYDLEARAEGYASARSFAVEASEDAPPRQIALEAGEPGRIEAVLRRGDGTGVAGVPVTVYDRLGSLLQSQPTLPSGSRVFEGLPAGEVFVAWADALAGAGATSRVRVSPRDPQVVEPELTTGASVVLACPAQRCAGAPAELIAVHSAENLELSPQLSGVSAGLRFSESADLSLGRLAPGRYLFRLWVDGERWRREVEIGHGEVRVLLP